MTEMVYSPPCEVSSVRPGQSGQIGQIGQIGQTGQAGCPTGYRYCTNYNTNAEIHAVCEGGSCTDGSEDEQGLAECRSICDATQCEYFTFYPASSEIQSYRNKCYLYQPGDCGALLEITDAAGYGARTFEATMCAGCLVQDPCIVANPDGCNGCMNTDNSNCRNGRNHDTEAECLNHNHHLWCGAALGDEASGPTLCDTTVATAAACDAVEGQSAWCGDASQSSSHGFTATFACTGSGASAPVAVTPAAGRSCLTNYTTEQACDDAGFFWIPPQTSRPAFGGRITLTDGFLTVRHVSFEGGNAVVSEVDSDAKSQGVEEGLYATMISQNLVDAGLELNSTLNISASVASQYYNDGLDMWLQIEQCAAAVVSASNGAMTASDAAYEAFTLSLAQSIQAFLATMGGLDLSAQFEPGNQGGGIFASGSSSSYSVVDLHSCDVEQNVAALGGGAGIYSSRATVNVRNAYFADNYARQGAGIFVSRGETDIRSTEFRRNRAGTAADTPITQAGGAMYCSDSVLYLASCLFHGNEARGDSSTLGVGGALYIARGTASIIETSFVENLAGISVNETYARDNNLIYNQEIMSSPDLDQLGGALYTAGGVILIQDSTFATNAAVLSAYGLSSDQQLAVDLAAATAGTGGCPNRNDCYCVRIGGGGGGGGGDGHGGGMGGPGGDGHGGGMDDPGGGCTDAAALNFDASAGWDDGSCNYGGSDWSDPIVSGSSDLRACSLCNQEILCAGHWWVHGTKRGQLQSQCGFPKAHFRLEQRCKLPPLSLQSSTRFLTEKVFRLAELGRWILLLGWTNRK